MRTFVFSTFGQFLSLALRQGPRTNQKWKKLAPQKVEKVNIVVSFSCKTSCGQSLFQLLVSFWSPKLRQTTPKWNKWVSDIIRNQNFQLWGDLLQFEGPKTDQKLKKRMSALCFTAKRDDNRHFKQLSVVPRWYQSGTTESGKSAYCCLV